MADPVWREKERIRLREQSKRRRANPQKRKHDRKVNAERMAERRNNDPDYREKANRQSNEIYHRNREFEAFMVALKETQGI